MFEEVAKRSLVCVWVLAGSAQAASVATAPWQATTVDQFLRVCSMNLKLCDGEVREALLNKIDVNKAPEVCLRSGHFQTPVIVWLMAHPETYKMPTEEGLYLSFKRVFPCH